MRNAKPVVVWAMALLLCLGFLLPFAPLPARAEENGAPAAASEAYVLADAETGQVIAAHNADLAEYPASITKIMTIALVLEHVQATGASLNDMVVVPEGASSTLPYNAARATYADGEEVTLGDLLYAAQVRSANDAANVLAQHVAGSVEEFARLMNRRAAQLGADGTQFKNPSGLHQRGHYTTAADMARIVQWALTVPGFREIFSATDYAMPATGLVKIPRYFTTNHGMLTPGYYQYEGATGGKTGFTDESRCTMVTTARRGDVELVCVVLNCVSSIQKYTDTAALLDYGFDNFERVVFPAGAMQQLTLPALDGDEQIGEVTVRGQDIPLLLHRRYSLADVTVSYSVPDAWRSGHLFAPRVCLSLPEGSLLQPALLADCPLLTEGAAGMAAGAGVAHATGQSLAALWFTAGAMAALLCAALVLNARRRRKAARLREQQQNLAALLRVTPPVPVRRPPPRPYTAHKSAQRRIVAAYASLVVVQGKADAAERSG